MDIPVTLFSGLPKLHRSLPYLVVEPPVLKNMRVRQIGNLFPRKKRVQIKHMKKSPPSFGCVFPTTHLLLSRLGRIPLLNLPFGVTNRWFGRYRLPRSIPSHPTKVFSFPATEGSMFQSTRGPNL